ncbi:hypothetical protein [Nannocystis exedens]|uniref:hypothetical protein n=1 Tax=Nannocystis exedens TaxID=54 RepID=UPI001160C23B|nr:hypothetical protein [Nannocystis exedens]
MPITLESFNLAAAERLICEQALLQAGSIVHAAKLLGVTSGRRLGRSRGLLRGRGTRHVCKGGSHCRR